jgi:uncharacterized DUF497 family protein
MVYTVFTRFEWGTRKARSKIVKHGVSFELALTTFDDPFGLVAIDDSHSTPDEQRELIIGESDEGLLVVIFTRRDQGKACRLIRARRANRRERRRYEDFKRIPI